MPTEATEQCQGSKAVRPEETVSCNGRTIVIDSPQLFTVQVKNEHGEHSCCTVQQQVTIIILLILLIIECFPGTKDTSVTTTANRHRPASLSTSGSVTVHAYTQCITFAHSALEKTPTKENLQSVQSHLCCITLHTSDNSGQSINLSGTTNEAETSKLISTSEEAARNSQSYTLHHCQRCPCRDSTHYIQFTNVMTFTDLPEISFSNTISYSKVINNGTNTMGLHFLKAIDDDDSFY